MYWEAQIKRLSQMTSKELREAYVGISQPLEKRPEGSFNELRNYVEHLKCEIGERIGKHRNKG